jgi:hypothetical protein
MQHLHYEVIEVGGETNINDEIIGAIAGIACREIEGVSSLGTSSIRRSISDNPLLWSLSFILVSNKRSISIYDGDASFILIMSL